MSRKKMMGKKYRKRNRKIERCTRREKMKRKR